MQLKTLNDFFIKAASDVNKLDTKPDNDTLLELYSFYKQGTVGDNNTDSPGFFDFKGNLKWNAWIKIKGMSKNDAQMNYIKLVKKLIE